jgi:hypothetical protein
MGDRTKGRRLGRFTAAAAVVAGIGALAAPWAAGAAGAAGSPLLYGNAGLSVVGGSPSVTESNQAGYLATFSAATATSGAAFTVPTVTCTSTPSSTWVQYFFTGSGTGVSFPGEVAEVEIGCSGGTATDTAYVGLDNTAAKSESVSPGDHVKVTGSMTAAGQSVSLVDTTGGARKIALHSAKVLTPEEIQLTIQSPWQASPATPLPAFTPVAFSSAEVNGAAIATLNVTEVIEVDTKGHTSVQPSPLNAAGTGFTLRLVKAT